MSVKLQFKALDMAVLQKKLLCTKTGHARAPSGVIFVGQGTIILVNQTLQYGAKNSDVFQAQLDRIFGSLSHCSGLLKFDIRKYHISYVLYLSFEA